MTVSPMHICVCICTFKRPNSLSTLLVALEQQITENLFTYSIVVADNDHQQSAKLIVLDFASKSPVPTVYCVEPVQNIALARNKALEYSQGEFVAFIDDDEVPRRDWLFNHFTTCHAYDADGCLGPVLSYFEQEPPHWVLEGKFFDRPRYATGYKMNWRETRTGNVFFKRAILNALHQPFRHQFGTGSEDVDFFRRVLTNGKLFVWCNDAVVYEIVPPARWESRYLIRMALLRGGNSFKHRTGLIESLLKSLVAIPAYLLILPPLFIAGHHHYMKYLVSFFDHTGRIFALLGYNLVKARII